MNLPPRKKIKALTAAALTAVSAACLFCAMVLNTDIAESDSSVIAPPGLSVISQEQWDEILNRSTEISLSSEMLIFNGGAVAFDAASSTFYVPQDMDSAEWEGFLSSYDGNLQVLEDLYLDDKSGAIAEGHNFSCICQSGSKYSQFSLVFTGLTTISIEYSPEETIIEKENHDGRVYVQETDGTCQVSECVFHVRGATSASYCKKSWKLSLTTASGAPNHISLCGMRSDDDWILNAMYTDGSRIREPLAYQVWSDMQTILGITHTGSDTRFAEVFLNDEYIGLYALTEPVDQKTFDLDQNGIIYKITDHSFGDLGDISKISAEGEWSLTKYNGMNEIQGAEIIWPNSGNDSAAFQWDILQDLYYCSVGQLSEDNLVDKGIIIDTELSAVYQLYINLLYALDNGLKNNIFACDLQDDNTYRITLTPWDLNFTFGDIWPGEFLEESASYNKWLYSWLWSIQAFNNPEEAEGALKDIWKQLRDGGFSAASVGQQAEDLCSELVDSGAFLRESARWPDTVDAENYSKLIKWIQAKFDTMDEMMDYPG